MTSWSVEMASSSYIAVIASQDYSSSSNVHSSMKRPNEAVSTIIATTAAITNVGFTRELRNFSKVERVKRRGSD